MRAREDGVGRTVIIPNFASVSIIQMLESKKKLSFRMENTLNINHVKLIRLMLFLLPSFSNNDERKRENGIL
jgi:hypothetical protein